MLREPKGAIFAKCSSRTHEIPAWILTVSTRNTGTRFIFYDNLRNAALLAVLDDDNGVPTPEVTHYKVGFKTDNPMYIACANAFFTIFSGISSLLFTMLTARIRTKETIRRCRQPRAALAIVAF